LTLKRFGISLKPRTTKKKPKKTQFITNNVETMEIPVEEDVLFPLLGTNDSNLRYLQQHFRSTIGARRHKIIIRGLPDEMRTVKNVLQELIDLVRSNGSVSERDIDTVLRLASQDLPGISEKRDNGRSLIYKSWERTIVARSDNQDRYIQAIRKHDIVFSTGPAGTGKTYIAVAAAVDWFTRGGCDRIILVRPVVEAGENLGFLPGDIKEKVDPYFRPLYDALFDMLPTEKLRKYLEQDIIEVAPLAYMRGRTLSHAFVILDEAQNTTPGQMKMFLTRLGYRSKAVITGDLTQIDLPDPEHSGMIVALRVLKGIEGIGFVELDASDVVRHRLVQDIIEAYEVHDHHHRSSPANHKSSDSLGSH
jgi:phosphate starvation-inducible PhoH-like protein